MKLKSAIDSFIGIIQKKCPLKANNSKDDVIFVLIYSILKNNWKAW